MSTSQNTSLIVQPYLCFEGRCEEALDFYRSALDAEVIMMMRFKENPEPPQDGDGCGGPAAPGDKIMHAAVRIGQSQVFLSDGRCTGKANFQGIFLSLTVENEAEADRRFAALNDGGQTIMPLMKTFFSPRFGMTTDRFGVSWMVIVKA